MKTSEHIALKKNFLEAFKQNLIHDIYELTKSTGVVIITPYPDPNTGGDTVKALVRTCVSCEDGPDGKTRYVECEDAPGIGIGESLLPRIVTGEPVTLKAVSCNEKGDVTIHVKVLDENKEGQWKAPQLDEDQLIIVHRELSRVLGFNIDQ